MSTVYKLLLFLIIFVSILIAGYSSFHQLNKKIKESKTGWEIFGYSFLLILINTALFFGGLFVLIKGYAFLVDAE
jgi:hypothetical protein